MTTEDIAPDQLDFLSFVDFAVAKTKEELPSVDATAMRLVLELHRVTSALVYDLESTVHRPSGWTWSGFRVLFVLWLAGPSESKRIAELSGNSRSATSALVKTLTRDALVRTEKSVSDGRAVSIALTERGRAAIADTFTRHNKREQIWADVLSRPERLVLIGLLEKLATGVAGREAIKRR
jgi:DNA-binding MarR family transcriptional regulator